MEAFFDNGQDFVALSTLEWEEVFRSGKLNGRSISEIFRLNSEEALTYAARYSELSLYVSDADGRFFIPQVFLQLQGYAQRVFLERLTCNVCAWVGMTADPFASDNYILLLAEVRIRLMKKALTFPRVPCPKCGAKLPRSPIWTEHL